MTRAVVVIECNREDLIEVVGLAQASVLNVGYPVQFHAAQNEDAEMVLDVFADAESGAGTHLVRVERADVHDHVDWALEHSLRCRKAGLLNCPLTTLVRIAADQQHMGPGVHRVWLDQTGVLLWEDA